MKQIVFTDIGKAELTECECREIKDNEVLVKTAFTTISNGTERANLMGDPSTNPYRDADDKPVFPKFFGYSGSGIVISAGKAVENVKAGDRVAMSWSCHAQYNICSEDNVTVIDDDRVTLSEASMTHIATFPMAAIRKTHLEMGESALVMGIGILGAFAVSLLRASGAVPIIAADPNKQRRELALQLGADYALDPTEKDFAEKVKELTQGGANTAIEVTGLGKGLQQALDCMARFGRVTLLGCTRNSDFTIDYYRKVHGPGITLIGAHTNARPIHESSPGWWTAADDRGAFLRMLAHGRIDAKKMISEVHSPADAPKVFDRLAYDKEFPFGVQFDWSKL